MIVFKCKMCGGEMELEEGATVAECPYCLTKQTLPKLDNDKRANMYDRANHFRRQNEYDKAMAIFENILQEDRTDAEAYWSLVLCRYGIEYVEDPATHKRVPTVNRVQYTSVLADEDYKSALEYADFAQRSVYESEAKTIDEIQKGILFISKQEKPFDVFICYKETDASGRRTPDSVLANDLYHQLTNEGFKVFFSRITLEDKIGTAYEPYIFAALNSAKVMVVLGTKPEYFNAVWVKNEWSRYLALIRAGADKTLVPAYRDMDPYDLPDEFSHLQAQDMSKLGFMQDLIRGIKKLTEQKTISTQSAAQQSSSSGANIESLLKRARLFMEDGDFKNASEYLDRVLDIDPECSSAYAAKVCVAFGLRKEQDLANTTFLYQDNSDWQKAVRFASLEQKTTYDQYISQVKTRVETQIRNYAYDCAVAMAVVPDSNRSQLDAELTAYKSACLTSSGQRANGGRRQNSKQYEAQFKQAVRNNEPGDVSEQNYKTSASMFEQIKDEEAQKCVGQCRVLAEQARQKNIYYQMVSKSRQQLSANELDQVASSLESIPGYSDAKSRAENCRKTAENIRKILYSDTQKAIQEAGNESHKWKQAVDKLKHSDLNGYRDISQLRTHAAKKYDECVKQEEEDRKQAKLQAERQAAAAAKKRKRNTILGVVAAIIVVATGTVYFTVIKPSNTYNSAIEALNAGNYDDATQLFESLGDYNEASVKAQESQYQKGTSQMSAGQYDDATKTFEALGNFSDAATQAKESQYQKGITQMGAGQYDDATMTFLSIQPVGTQEKSSEEETDTENSNLGSLYAQTRNQEGYRDSVEKALESRYQKAQSLDEKGDYVNACYAFQSINGYKDVGTLLDKVYEILYTEANNCYNQGDVIKARQYYFLCRDYKDSHTLLRNNIREYSGKISIARSYPVEITALKSDGTVLNLNAPGEKTTNNWQGVKAIMNGDWVTLGLKGDGTVYAAGDSSFNKEYSLETYPATWKNISYFVKNRYMPHAYSAKDGILYRFTSKGGDTITLEPSLVDIADFYNGIYYIRADGTAIYKKVSSSYIIANEKRVNESFNNWKNVVSLDTDGNGLIYLIGLDRNGKVLIASTDEPSKEEDSVDYAIRSATQWTDIIDIAAGEGSIVGLKVDGTVVVAWKYYKGECDGWRDIVAIATDHDVILGLKVDGTIVSTPLKDYEANEQITLNNWKLWD